MDNKETAEHFRSTFMAQTEYLSRRSQWVHRTWKRHDIFSHAGR